MQNIFAIASIFVCVIATAAVGGEGIDQQFSFRIYDTLHLAKTFELEDAEPGAKIRATVILENELQNSFELQKVDLGCKCTKANVPKVTLGPGDVIACDFEFELPDSPRRTAEQFSATIYCAGAVKVVRMNFNSAWKHLVALPQTDLTVTYLREEKFKEFEIPLVFAEHAPVIKTRIQVSDELRKLSTSLKVKNDRASIVAGFSPALLGSDPVSGEVEVTSSDGKYQSRMLLMLRPVDAVSVVPSRVAFVPTTENGYLHRGLVILKIRNARTNSEVAVREVSVSTSSGQQLDIRYERFSEQNFRVEVFCKKPDDLRAGDKLNWNIVLADGSKANIESEQFFSQ